MNHIYHIMNNVFYIYNLKQNLIIFFSFIKGKGIILKIINNMKLQFSKLIR